MGLYFYFYFITKQNLATYLAVCVRNPWDIAAVSCLGGMLSSGPLCSPQIHGALKHQHPMARGGNWGPAGIFGQRGAPWTRFLDGCRAPTPPPTTAAALIQLEMRRHEL